MIPTLSRFSPNSPQTPARQTAPTDQRPGAQRQGFSKAFFEQGRQSLKGLKNLQPKPNMTEAQETRLCKTLYAGWNDFHTIASEFSRLATDEAYNQNKSEVEATLSEKYPGLLGVFQAFDAECPADGRSMFIQTRINQALKLCQDFETLLDRLFPGSL